MSKANAAETKVEEKQPIIICFKTTDGIYHRLSCGTYTFEKKSSAEGGPIMLTLLKGVKREPDNEPLHVIGGVINFHVLDARNPDDESISTLVYGSVPAI